MLCVDSIQSTVDMMCGTRDLDDTASVEDMPFEAERGSLTSVNSTATVCTTDSSSSGGSVNKVRLLVLLLFLRSDWSVKTSLFNDLEEGN